MKENTKKSRGILLEKIIDIIIETIQEGGLEKVSARYIASKANLTVGKLYLVVDNLESAISMANARILDMIDRSVVESVRRAQEIDGVSSPVEICKVLAVCYAQFALDNKMLWSALFAFNPKDESVLGFHRASQGALMSRVMAPLALVRPDLSRDVLEQKARTFFGAVHGVVLMSMEDRYLGVDKTLLFKEIEDLVAALIHGFSSVKSQK